MFGVIVVSLVFITPFLLIKEFSISKDSELVIFDALKSVKAPLVGRFKLRPIINLPSKVSELPSLKR